MSYIHLPFIGGQNQTPDPKIAPLGTLKRVENCRIDKEGRLVKRHGYATVGQATWLGGLLSFPIQGIWSREGERVVVAADRLYSFSNQGWRDWGLLSSVAASERREAIHSKVASIAEPSTAVIGTMVAVVGTCDQTGVLASIQGVVFDAADWSVRDQAVIEFGAFSYAPQVIAVGTSFVCVWNRQDPGGIPSNNDLYFSVYDTTAATNAHWTPPALLANPARNAFDICPYDATTYLVVTGSNLYTANTSGIVTTTAFTSLGANAGQMAVCGAPGESVSIAWLEHSPKTLRVRSWPGSGGNPFGGVSPGTVVVGTNVAWSAGPTLTRRSATVHTVAISTNPRGGLTGGIVAEQTDWTEFNPTTGGLGAVTTRYGFQLASKSYYDGPNRIYTWGENFSTFERCYFLEAHTTPSDGTIQTTFARGEAAEVTTTTANARVMIAPPSIARLTLGSQSYLLTGLPIISIGSVARANPTTSIDIAEVQIATFDVMDRYQSAEIGGCLYLAGGLLQMFDSQLAFEVGFLSGPNIRTVTPGALAGSGLVGGGTYQYVIVREWRDAQSQRHISGVSDPVSVTLGPTDNLANVTYDQNLQNNRVGRWISGAIGSQFSFVTHIYRTLNGGTVFYRVTDDKGIRTLAGGSGPALATYQDRKADSELAGPAGQNVVLYTQGQRGGLSGPLQHDPPPPCRYIWAGKDRVILGGLEKPDEVRWSKFFFTGEPLEFSEDLAFRKRVPGRVKAVASLDDAWIVFTETRAYAIFGDGPDDSGVGSFSEPREIPSGVGCYDWRSLVVTPLGLMFQGRADAIYLLPRGLGAPTEISRPVIDTLRLEGMRITAARLMVTQGVVVFSVSVGSPSESRPNRHLVYDLRTGQWTVDFPFVGLAGANVGLAEWDSLLAFCVSDSIYIEQPAYSDSGSWYGLTIETQPLRPGGLQRSVRCRRVEAIGEWRGNAGLRLSIAPDDIQSFPYNASWTITGLVSGDMIRREWRLPVQKFGSVKVLLEETQNAADITAGLALTGITFESVTREGPPRLGLANRA